MLKLITNDGSDAISLFNPVTMQCGDPVTGKVILNNQNLTNPTTSTATFRPGGGAFSRITPGKWFAFGMYASSTVNSLVTPLNFSTTDGTFTISPPIANFIHGMPVGANVQEWQPNTVYAYGAYVKHTMVAGEYLTWAPGATFALGDVLFPAPGHNNPNGCAFKLNKTTGVTGAGEPNWASKCNQNISTITDNLDTWQSLSFGGPVFIYQAIVGGTSGAVNTFIPGSKHPEIFLTNTDNTVTWENVGVNVLDTIWTSVSAISRDERYITESVGNNNYGTATGCTSNACGGQGSAFFTLEYDAVANVFYLLNTATMIQSEYACSTGLGGGANCAGGT